MDKPATAGVLDEFQTEFAQSWRRLPNKGFFFGLLVAWVGLFYFLGTSTFGHTKTTSLFGWMWAAYNNRSADDAYANLIPFLVIGLFWWKRSELLDLPLRLWPPALIIVAGGLLLHIAGYLVQEERISIVALFLGIYGLMGLAWGPEWLRKGFFPFFLFIFCVPSSLLLQPITLPLRVLVTSITEWIAHYILAIDVIRAGTQLYDPFGAYQYDVAAACSGIRSLVAIFLLTLVYGFVTFQSPWKRLVMVALAFPFSVLGNLIRMLFIIIAASLGGQAWGNYVHESTVISLIPYVPAILGVLYLGRLMETRDKSEAPSQ